MAFIFTAEGDPRREHVTETFKAEQTVKWAGHINPATIISGPHKTHGVGSRWLIRKADDTVSLVRETELSVWVDRRIALVARTLYQSLSGTALRTGWTALPLSTRTMYTGLAKTVLAALDAEAVTPEPKATAVPLSAGDRIRILEDRHATADVRRGDILTVRTAGDRLFSTSKPVRSNGIGSYVFRLSAEGTGWARA
jgi:hypothetical protein